MVSKNIDDEAELIPLIKKGLLKGQSRELIRRAVLCNRKAVHIHREAWDASWGCGFVQSFCLKSSAHIPFVRYRNFLMACANLMSQTQQPLYSPLLDSPPPPSVRNLQDWIESAWKEGQMRPFRIPFSERYALGFDPEGQKELKNLVGTSKWIGTAGKFMTPETNMSLTGLQDLWVAFSYRGIPFVQILLTCSQSSPIESQGLNLLTLIFGTIHKASAQILLQSTVSPTTALAGIQILIDWVVDYFSMETADTSPKNAFEFMKIPQITVTEKMPIILQHNGHSRTIVGYEIDKNGVLHLLAFDPGQ
jgi:hypothetical protein